MVLGAWRLTSMEQKRPQLNLSELHQVKWLLGGALAMLAAWSVLYVEVEAWLWLGLITAGVPVVLRWPLLTLRIPRWVHRLAFPLFVALAATDYYIGKEVMPALIRLSLMLLFYRAVTTRRRRDDLQLIVLGLFLVVVSGVLSVSLAFAFQIVAFTGCTLVLLLVMNLIDAAESGQPVVVYSLQTPPVWMQLEWLRLGRRLREATDWRLATLGVGLFGGVVGLSSLLFFALPRFEFSNNLFLDNLITQKSKTGFSENVSFGDVTDIQQDTSVALSVDVSDPSQIPAQLYWRMLVLDEYAKGTFSTSEQLKRQLLDQRQPAQLISGGARPSTGDSVWTFYLEGGTSSYLPLLGDFSRLQFNDGPQTYAIHDTLRLLRLNKTPAKMFAYRVEGMRPASELGAPEVSPPRDVAGKASKSGNAAAGGERELLTRPSFLDIKLDSADRARLDAWVGALNAPSDDAAAFARLATQWLAQTHFYSMRMTLAAGTGDPLVRWMSSDSPGHCELFAGAFTLLARSAGYPARMVTGFRGGSWNTTSRNLTIRNSDAHAWCELFDAKKQTWMRVDPTPGAPEVAPDARLENAAALLARISDRSWSAKLDGLRVFWYRRIVDFDQKAQAELARSAKVAIENRAQQLKQSIRRLLKEAGEWLQRPWDLRRLLVIVAVVVGGAGVALGWTYWLRDRWRRWRSGLTHAGLDPVRREAGHWLRRLKATQPQGAGTVEGLKLQAELERLRYGPKTGWPDARATFGRARRACR
jgi:hypothetical protein